MKLTMTNVKITGGDRRFVLAQLQKYADRFSDRIFSEVELSKVTDGTYAITAYDTNGMMLQRKDFEKKDFMIGFILGANAHMTKTHIIKELD